MISNNSSDDPLVTDNVKHDCGIPAFILDSLRRKALARQRPSDYYRPCYKKHRDAREELELMGVEVIDNLDDECGDIVRARRS